MAFWPDQFEERFGGGLKKLHRNPFFESSSLGPQNFLVSSFWATGYILKCNNFCGRRIFSSELLKVG